MPTAIAHNAAGRRKDAEGEFCRKVIEQNPNGGLQGLYIVNTDGKLIAFVYEFKPEAVMRTLQKVLKDFQAVEAPAIKLENRDPKYGQLPPEGGLVVDVTSKVLGGYEKSDNWLRQAQQASLGRDHLWVRKDEVDALSKGELPESLKTRIARFHLVDNTRGTPTGWAKTEIKKLEMTLVDGCLKGSVHFETQNADRGYQADILGFIQAKDGKVTRFDVVASGRFWGEGKYTPGAPKGKFPFAVAFTVADPQDILYKVLPEGIRSYADYLR